MRISDWSSDVCASERRALQCLVRLVARARLAVAEGHRGRLVGGYVRPGDPFFASLMASPKVAPAAPEGQSEALGYTVAALIRASREDKVGGASQSTQRADRKSVV